MSCSSGGPAFANGLVKSGARPIANVLRFGRTQNSFDCESILEHIYIFAQLRALSMKAPELKVMASMFSRKTVPNRIPTANNLQIKIDLKI